MTLVDYLQVLRRRWKLIALAAILVGAIAFVTAPEPPAATPGVSSTGYQATATLLQAPNSTTDVNLPLIQLYIKTGSIPAEAAKLLKTSESPTALASAVVVSGDPNTATVTITATDASAERAIAIANAFADATVNYLQENQQQNTQRSIAGLQESLTQLKTQIETLTAQLATTPKGTTDSSILNAQRDGLLQQYQGLYQRLTQLQTQPAEAASLDVLQRAVAVPVAASSSAFAAPKSRTSRTGLGVLIGVLLGIAGALVAERFDTRLRSRGSVERAFRLPVVAEIPKVSRRVRHRYTLAAAAEPDGASAEAFRTLRSALTLMPSVPMTFGDDVPLPGLPTAREAQVSGPPKVIVVTSPSPGVGKSTAAANLATCLAEAGKSVIVLDCDFRHPELHTFFEVDNQTGLSDMLASGEFTGLASLMRTTRVVGVSLVPAGTASWIPTRLVQHVDAILAQARALADVVVIDSPPLLGASEAADLAANADSVIVAAWAGRTTGEHAERTVDLLARVGAPTLGVALVTTGGTASYASGAPGQRGWPMSMVDHRGSRAVPRDRSRSGGRGTRGR